jgi:hypothetical protein
MSPPAYQRAEPLECLSREYRPTLRRWYAARSAQRADPTFPRRRRSSAPTLPGYGDVPAFLYPAKVVAAVIRFGTGPIHVPDGKQRAAGKLVVKPGSVRTPCADETSMRGAVGRSRPHSKFPSVACARPSAGAEPMSNAVPISGHGPIPLGIAERANSNIWTSTLVRLHTPRELRALTSRNVSSAPVLRSIAPRRPTTSPRVRAT